MMAHAVILETDGHGLVRTLTSANLTFARGRHLTAHLTLLRGVQSRHDGRLGVAQVADALAPLTGF